MCSNPLRAEAARDNLAALPMADRLAHLREQMSAISARAGAPERTSVPGHDVLPVPGPLGELLPDHGLARGTMVTCPRGAVLCGFLAAATAAGQHAAILTDPTGPQIGLLAASEMGADLQRLFLVRTPTDRAAEIVGVLADGIDLIVLDLPRARIAPTALEKLRGRLRAKGSILVATRTDWARHAHLDLQVRRRPDYGLVLQRHSCESVLVVLWCGVGSCCGRVGFVDDTGWCPVHPVRATGSGPGVRIGAGGRVGTEERVDSGRACR